MNILFHSFFIGICFLSLFLAHRENRKWRKFSFHFLFLVTSFALITHSLNFVDNFKVIDMVRFNSKSLPFNMYINFDKPFVALIIFGVLGFGTVKFDFQKVLKWSGYILLSGVFTLFALAMSLNYVQFDPKFPPESIIWSLNNLFLVCTAEEALFRRYIQGGVAKILTNYPAGNWVAIILAAILFGFTHFAGGVGYIFLASIAGIFYGYAYFKSQRVEAAIVVHFGLNAIHFFFFSYPALSTT